MKKTALVTGGARRLGKDISLALAASGFNLIINYNSTAEELVNQTLSEVRSFGVDCHAVKADVSKTEGIIWLFDEARREFNELDVLVNNAAIFEHYDFFDIDEEAFSKFINTNLKSTLFCSQYAAKWMLENKNEIKSIINISSLGGILNWTGYIPYSLSKIGVIKLTELLAKKLAPEILVNSIAPGTVIVNNDENKNVDEEEVKKYPMKRFASSDDITSLVKYLAVENKYITGQTIAVDGGRSL